ncbi:MAG: TetR/AcrR family transcriptional regulator [Mycobacterium sp.]
MTAVSDTVPTARGGGEVRQRILAAAADLFYRDGIIATGVDRLSEQASVSKRTFYKYFPSKADLVEHYLRDLEDGNGYPMERALGRNEEPPRQRLLGLFDGTASDRLRGCAFHNAAVEAPGTMPNVEGVVHAHKRAFIERLVTVAAEAGARDPRRLANQIAVVFEGAAALSTSLNDVAPFAAARSAAETLIDDALTERRTR